MKTLAFRNIIYSYSVVIANDSHMYYIVFQTDMETNWYCVKNGKEDENIEGVEH